MVTNKTYIPAIFTVALLAILHFAAMKYYWYVRYPGYDIIMHILGGAAIAFTVYWILVTFFKKIKISFWRIVLITIGVGIVWEMFEAINDIAGGPFGSCAYNIDTAKDLIDDTLGALVAAYLTVTSFKRK